MKTKESKSEAQQKQLNIPVVSNIRRFFIKIYCLLKFKNKFIKAVNIYPYYFDLAKIPKLPFFWASPKGRHIKTHLYDATGCLVLYKNGHYAKVESDKSFHK